MLFLNFARIFKLRGINRPFSHLVKSGYSENFATRLATNKVNEITCDRLESFCMEFNCTPNDIYDFRPTKNKLIPGHVLHSLTKKEFDVALIAKLDSLSPEKLQQVQALLKDMD